MKKINHTAVIIILLFLYAPSFSDAATLILDMPKTASKGQEEIITVRINTTPDKINAVSGTIIFDPTFIEVRDIYDGSSAVTLWLERPHQTGRGISFSGITPGGFQGLFTLFSLKVVYKADGKVNIGASDLAAYKNNGEGTAVPLTFKLTAQTIVNGTATGTISFADLTPPERFTLIVSSSPDLFGGIPFVSWSASDKGTGIDHYEYAYSRFGSPDRADWRLAVSPLQIDAGALSKEIYIKAVDKAGNVRIAHVAGPARYRTFGLWGILSVIVLLIACAFLFLRRRSSSLSR